MTCYICWRAEKGFGYYDKRFCSRLCQDIHYKNEKITGETTMIDANDQELIAAEHAGMMGGEYLNELSEKFPDKNKFDVTELEPAEWHQFIRCIIGGFTDKLREQQAAIVQRTK